MPSLRARKTSRTMLLGLQVCGESVFLSICRFYFLFHRDCSIYPSAFYESAGSALLFTSHALLFGVFFALVFPFLDIKFLFFSVVSFYQLKVLFMAAAFAQMQKCYYQKKAGKETPKAKRKLLIISVSLMKAYTVVV